MSEQSILSVQLEPDQVVESQEREDHLEAAYRRGRALLETGAFAEAAEQYHQVLKIRPGHIRAAYDLTFTGKWVSGDEAHRKRLVELLDSATSDSDRAYVHFALGKLLDDQGQYDRAFAHVHEGNRLAGARHDRDAHDRFVTALIDAHSRFITRIGRPVGSLSDRPVFIVGMPRSGTSLVEEILARHPGVAGGGELLTIDRIAGGLPAAIGTERLYPACLEDISAAAISQAAGEYLAELSAISPAALRVTDKMPLNFMHLGLIEAIFPKAVIVHCRRDPVDTCLSCYFQFFSPQFSFSFDLEDLGHYYQAYERLMGHYNCCSSLNILEVHYEKLVSRTEAVAQSLLRHCKLPWEPRCLGGATVRRPVKAESSWQVRQPMYTSSVARWRRYQAHLGPLLAALGEFANPPSPVAR